MKKKLKIIIVILLLLVCTFAFVIWFVRNNQEDLERPIAEGHSVSIIEGDLNEYRMSNLNLWSKEYLWCKVFWLWFLFHWCMEKGKMARTTITSRSDATRKSSLWISRCGSRIRTRTSCHEGKSSCNWNDNGLVGEIWSFGDGKIPFGQMDSYRNRWRRVLLCRIWNIDILKRTSFILVLNYIALSSNI